MSFSAIRKANTSDASAHGNNAPPASGGLARPNTADGGNISTTTSKSSALIPRSSRIHHSNSGRNRRPHRIAGRRARRTRRTLEVIPCQTRHVTPPTTPAPSRHRVCWKYPRPRAGLRRVGLFAAASGGCVVRRWRWQAAAVGHRQRKMPAHLRRSQRLGHLHRLLSRRTLHRLGRCRRHTEIMGGGIRTGNPHHYRPLSGRERMCRPKRKPHRLGREKCLASPPVDLATEEGEVYPTPVPGDYFEEFPIGLNE